MENNVIRTIPQPESVIPIMAPEHVHEYTVPCTVQLNRFDEEGTVLTTSYYRGLQCQHCNDVKIYEWQPQPTSERIISFRVFYKQLMVF